MAEYSRDSSFNMGIAHLTRIDALLYDIANCASEEDYEGWHKCLTILSREVSFLYNEDEEKDNAKKDNDCANAISEFKNDKTFENKKKVYNALIRYELFTKQQLATRRMLMAFSKDLKVSISDLE